MAGSIKSRSLVAIVLFAEVFTLAVLFGLPALQGRVYSYPHFPQVIVFHDRPPGSIVDFQGNFFAAAAESTFVLDLHGACLCRNEAVDTE